MERLKKIIFIIFLLLPINLYAYELRVLPVGSIQGCGDSENDMWCYTLDQTKDLFQIDADYYTLKLDIIQYQTMIVKLNESLSLQTENTKIVIEENKSLFKKFIDKDKDFNDCKSKIGSGSSWIPWGITGVTTTSTVILILLYGLKK